MCSSFQCSSLISWVAENWAYQQCCPRKTHQWESCFVSLQKHLSEVFIIWESETYLLWLWMSSLCMEDLMTALLNVRHLFYSSLKLPCDSRFSISLVVWWPSIIVSVLLCGHTSCSGLCDSVRNGTESLNHFLSPEASWRIHSLQLFQSHLSQWQCLMQYTQMQGFAVQRLVVLIKLASSPFFW